MIQTNLNVILLFPLHHKYEVSMNILAFKAL